MLKMFSDCRLANSPVHYFSKERNLEEFMKIPKQLLKSVCFLFVRSGGKLTPVGTAFFIHIEEGLHTFLYLATAKHVVKYMREHSDNDHFFIRVNSKEGKSLFIENSFEQWEYHVDSRVDAAVMKVEPYLPENQYDYLSVPITMMPTKDLLECQVSIGEEVCVVGLLQGYWGKEKNTPIPILGNLAYISEEEPEQYLINATTVPGYSGSPVFSYSHGMLETFLKKAINERLEKETDSRDVLSHSGLTDETQARQLYWLGLLHAERRYWSEEKGEKHLFDTGISLVTPASKIAEIIDSSIFKDDREQTIRKGINYPTEALEERWK